MNALLVLIPLSLGMGLVGLGVFIWALRHDQFDDPEGNAARVLTPEDPIPPTEGETDDRLASHPEDRHRAGGL